MNTPILLIIWRRPATLSSLIEALRPLEPSNIYVASDGPITDHSELGDKIQECRALIDERITWPCRVNRLYSNVNFGCSVGPIRAINWFFSQVSEGIILEDDCIPHPDFLHYCEALLEYYRHDSRVWCISGNNFQDGSIHGDGSYFFSKIPLIWGWATWRRCWQHYDASLASWPQLKLSGLLEGSLTDRLAREFWSAKWDLSFQGQDITWWDYQWIYTCIANGGLCAHPNMNLVNNIGSGPEATHTTGYIIPTPLSANRLGRISHPAFVLSDPCADHYLFNNVFGGYRLRKQKKLSYRVYHRLYRLCKSVKRLIDRLSHG